MKVTISLIGEQPIPNLLPLRYQPPDVAVLVHTDRTRRVAQRLEELLAPKVTVRLLPTDPYDVGKIREDLKKFLAGESGGGEGLEFNLTGGTKTMVLAAYEVAREYNAPFLYLQSEGKQSVLYRYRFKAGKPHYERREIIPEVLKIKDYLEAHVGDCKVTGARHKFEEEIGNALEGAVDEVMIGVTLAGALEVDLVVRKENQVGVIQAKTGGRARSKEGLRELNAACAREYLGIYTRKILVVDQRWDPTLTNLRDLAEAWGIKVIELPSFSQSGSLSDEDKKRLRSEVIKVLTG
jgi:hypothetical protein